MTNETKRTLGPWIVIEQAPIEGLNLCGEIVSADDAALIAAAPALLDALITVRDYWTGGDAPEEITRQINDAINQAKGKS